MQAYLNGDIGAFDALYRRHSRRIYGYLRKRLRQPEELDEVFQKIFMKFHQARRKFDFRYTVLQWLFVISKTSLLDHLRQTKRQEAGLEGIASQNPGSSLEPTDISELLDTLPATQQGVMRMRALDELSYEEIARKLSVSPESARQGFSRAVRKLRKIVREPAGGSP